ncbi:MAG: hypothetical protein ACK50G_00945 [bacterium]|jgi:hypothetical protein
MSRIVVNTNLVMNKRKQAVEGLVVLRDGHLVGAGTRRVQETGTEVALRDGDVVARWAMQQGKPLVIVMRVNKGRARLVGYIEQKVNIDRVGRIDLDAMRDVLRGAPLPPVVKEAARTLRWRIVGMLIRQRAGISPTQQELALAMA